MYNSCSGSSRENERKRERESVASSQRLVLQINAESYIPSEIEVGMRGGKNGPIFKFKKHFLLLFLLLVNLKKKWGKEKMCQNKSNRKKEGAFTKSCSKFILPSLMSLFMLWLTRTL